MVGDDARAGAAVHPDPHLQPWAVWILQINRDGGGGGDRCDGEAGKAGRVVSGLETGRKSVVQKKVPGYPSRALAWSSVKLVAAM